MTIILLSVLCVIGIAALAAVSYATGYSRGRSVGRMEVLDRWWDADNAKADRQAHIDAATLDEIVKRNPTGGIVPPFITDRIPGHEGDQP